MRILIAALLAAFAVGAHAQKWPEKPVKPICTSPASIAVVAGALPL